MACLNFIILKVNGADVSGVSQEEAIRVLLTAAEPITVEVRKRLSGTASEGGAPRRISVAVQTDGQEEEEEEEVGVRVGESLEELEDIEEVTLRKSESSERIGLTVTYVAPHRVSATPPDPPTEVYISNITPDSVAARDGRLRQGDQILQVNGCDVSDKEETESLFAENPNAVTLLVSRCALLSPDAVTALTTEVDALDVRSDQHIYETIPEDETDAEPIYCSPHDSDVSRQLAFEVRRDKMVLGESKWRWWRPPHHYVDLTPRELPSSVSQHEVGGGGGGRRVRNSTSAATLPAATIYTSPANLESAIALQERLYRRAMEKPAPPPSTDTPMEWKVKRRHDGTRYIVRRPIEARRHKERARWRRRHQEKRQENLGLLSVTIV